MATTRYNLNFLIQLLTEQLLTIMILCHSICDNSLAAYMTEDEVHEGIIYPSISR